MTNNSEHSIIPYHNEIFIPKTPVLAQKGLDLLQEQKITNLDIYKDGRQLFPGINDRICAYYSKNDSSLWITNFGRNNKPKQLWKIDFVPYNAQEILSIINLDYDNLYYRDLRQLNRVYCIAVINDELLFYGKNSNNGPYVYIMDYKKGHEIDYFTLEGTVFKISISGDKDILAVGTSGGVYISSLEDYLKSDPLVNRGGFKDDSCVIRGGFTASKGFVCHISIIDNKKIALIGGTSQGLLCLDLKTMNIIKDFGAKECFGICVNNEKSLALASDEQGVNLINLSDLSIINQWPSFKIRFDPYNRQVIDFSPDGKNGIVEGGNGYIIWNLYTGQIKYNISTSKITENGEIRPRESNVGYSADGKKVYIFFHWPGDVWEIDIR